jgi:hypothetical protein
VLAAFRWCFAADWSAFEDLRGETKGLLRVFAASFNFLRLTVNGDDMLDIASAGCLLKLQSASTRLGRRAECGA